MEATLDNIKATVENLKANRTEVINILTSKFGQQNLKSAAHILFNRASFAEEFNTGETIENCIDSIDPRTFRERKMKVADYLAALNNHEPFNYKAHWARKNF